MSSCSVIMVSYYTGQVIFPAIKSVLSQEGLAELIVVDNGNVPSTLGRLQKMAQADPRMKIVTGGGNVGFARGCNEGATFATSDFLLFLNPDCLLPSDALIDLMKVLAQPDVKVAGGLLQNPDNSDQKGYRYEVLTPFSSFRLRRRDAGLPVGVTPMAAISSACMCVRREDFLGMNGFDPAYFVYLAGRDYCLRVNKTGAKVVLVPGVCVTRLLGASGQMPSRFVQWQVAGSLMHYFHKHFPGVGAWLADVIILTRFIWRMTIARMLPRYSPRRVYRPKLAARKLILLACGLAEMEETKELEGKIVVVTGAASQLGLCVVRRLIASGAAVLAITHDENVAFAHSNLRWMRADLEDEKFTLGEYLADAVIHCAPLTQLPGILYTLADAEVSRVIAFGSASIFSEAMSRSMDERDHTMHLQQAEDKIVARCKKRGMNLTLMRPTLSYGYGLDNEVSLLARFIRRFGFFMLYPPANGRRQPVHVDDLAIAALSALEAKVTFGKSYNLGGSEAVHYRQMIEQIFVLSRRDVRIMSTPMLPFILDVAGRLIQKKSLNGEMARRMNQDIVFFQDESRQDFGYAPRGFLTGGAKDLGGY